MTEDLKKAIESLREVSPKLNAATDEANRVVALVEEFLNDECSIGLPVEREVPELFERVRDFDQTGETMGRAIYLAYERLGDKYRIVLKTVAQTLVADEDDRYNPEWEDGEPGKKIAWPEATRNQKLLSFPILLDLLMGIASQANKCIKGVAETTEAVEKILGALKAE